MDFRQNTRNLLSLSPRRLLATGAALVAFACAPSVVQAVGTPPSTWVALAALPGSNHGTVFGLAVDPTNTSDLLAGDSAGAIFRSSNAGTTWSRVYGGNSRVLTISFDPLNPTIVIAGTLRQGAVISTDGGAHWSATNGLAGHAVDAVAFAREAMFAATDHGVFRSADGMSWSQSGLDSAVQAIAVLAVSDPIRVVAGGSTANSTVAMYMSSDGAATWSSIAPAVTGTFITRLASGPVRPGANIRPLIVGTNTGLFISSDNGSSFTALSGAQLLPSIDYTQAAFAGGHFDRFYVGSDGGGSNAGGVWATADSGQHFSSLRPPAGSVTALALSSDEQPVLYVATLGVASQSPNLWAYRDTGGLPQGPFGTAIPSASAARTSPAGPSLLDELRALGASPAPYIGIGVIALLVILLAAVSHFRSRRR